MSREIPLTPETTWETYDGLKMECPVCNRDLFVASLVGGFDCECDASFSNLRVEVSESPDGETCPECEEPAMAQLTEKSRWLCYNCGNVERTAEPPGDDE